MSFALAALGQTHTAAMLQQKTITGPGANQTRRGYQVAATNTHVL